MAKNFEPAEKQHNSIAPGTRIKGEVQTEGDIRIDGEVEGTLICKGKLVLGPKGKINGEINCGNGEIMGTIDGKLKVNALLSLKSSAKVTGEVVTNKLSIEPGAVFSVTCRMGDTSTSKPITPKNETKK